MQEDCQVFTQCCLHGKDRLVASLSAGACTRSETRHFHHENIQKFDRPLADGTGLPSGSFSVKAGALSPAFSAFRAGLHVIPHLPGC